MCLSRIDPRPAVSSGRFPPRVSAAGAALAADTSRWGPALDLAEGVGDLLFGELRLLHGSRPLLASRRSRHSALVSSAVVFGGDVSRLTVAFIVSDYSRKRYRFVAWRCLRFDAFDHISAVLPAPLTPMGVLRLSM